jgi:hypothetical protein
MTAYIGVDQRRPVSVLRSCNSLRDDAGERGHEGVDESRDFSLTRSFGRSIHSEFDRTTHYRPLPPLCFAGHRVFFEPISLSPLMLTFGLFFLARSAMILSCPFFDIHKLPCYE